MKKFIANEVLILNRRCIKNPEKGGAEIYTYHLAKALIEKGISVEWFCCHVKGLTTEEKIENIKFIRKGSELTTHFWGFLYAIKKKKCLIIDEFNGMGFFTFFKKNSIILIHQLYDNFWTSQLGILGYPFKLLEKIFLFLYRKKTAITVSQSTYNDLKNIGFKDIKIIHNGLETEAVNFDDKKKPNLTLVYLGRLKKTKNPEDAIKAYFIVKKLISECELIIIGDGPLFSALKSKYENIDGIKFTGYIDDIKKLEILKKAHFLLVPSIREGWGQVVIQANAMGTPAIGYNVSGLRDSIIDGKTGFLVKDYKEMAEVIIKLWRDKSIYKELKTNALLWAKNFSWEKTKKDFINYLKERHLI